MSTSNLLGHMMEELVEAGIEIHLHPAKRIASDDGGTISGGFSDEEKLLEVAAKRDDWLLVLAHEYCHFKQWQDGIFDELEVIAAYSVFTPWLLKKRELPPEMLETFIRKMQWLEWENENRTIELLRQFRVDFDEEDYIKKVNIYLHSYELCRRTRKWHKKSLYDVPELLELVSGDEIIGEEEWALLPEGFEALALPCYEFSESTGEDDHE